ncbi:MAG: hypothetical protein V4659_00885, partial [Pseudomonadota bacterium]
TLLFAAFVLALPIVAILVANGVDLTTLGNPAVRQPLSPGAGGAIALYCLVLVPLLLWLTARAYLLTSAVVVAEHRALGAIGRAWQLSRGSAGRIVGVILLFLVVMIVAGLAATLVFGSIFKLALGGDGPISAASVLTALIVALVSTVFSVIATVFPAKLYVALRDRAPAG